MGPRLDFSCLSFILTLALASVPAYCNNIYIKKKVVSPGSLLETLTTPTSLIGCCMACEDKRRCDTVIYDEASRSCSLYRAPRNPSVQGAATVEVFTKAVPAQAGQCDSSVDEDMDNGGATYPVDCMEIFNSGEHRSGVYLIKPASSPQPFQVRCEMTDDAGWTVLLRRYDGSVDFYRTWQQYKAGFGCPDGEYYVGNDRLHVITQANVTLRVEFTQWSDDTHYYADFQTFLVDSEASNYKLHVGDFSGNATNDALRFHNNMMFSTKDRDNDVWGGNCAQYFHGAWWYIYCRDSQLTGLYPPTCSTMTCMAWHSGSSIEPLKAASMKVKPRI